MQVLRTVYATSSCKHAAVAPLPRQIKRTPHFAFHSDGDVIHLRHVGDSKMAASGKEQEQTVSRLFTELKVAREDEDYERGLRIVEKILSLSPSDADALHCKLVCLIQLGRIQDALKLIDASSDEDYAFEKAYCFYRLEKYAESRSLLLKQPQEELRVRELLAQIAFRQERYGEAREIYSRVVEECSDDFSKEREANFVAALAQSDGGIEVGELRSLPGETMEQCFNQACCFLRLEDGEKAFRVLQRAEELCRQSLQEEDYTDDEIEGELAVIRLQMGYSLQMQLKSKEALALYSQVLKQKPSEVSYAVIASNNIIVLNRDRDIFDSKKKIKILASEGGSKKLNRAQRLTILFNRCLFALQLNQLEQCRQLVGELRAAYPSSDLTTLAEAALLHREKKSSACLELLEARLSEQPSSASLPIYFTLAQLHVGLGSLMRACKVLQSIRNLNEYLGVVGVLTALYTSLGSVEEAVEVLDCAVVHWSKHAKSEADRETRLALMMESGRYKLQHGKTESAAAVLEKVRSETPTDLEVMAALVTAYSRFNSPKVEEVCRSLPPLPAGGEVDVDALEQMASFRHTRRQAQKPETDQNRAEVATKTGKRKRKQKQKLPKKFDPSLPPDPERWLPLRERSYYRKGRRKGFLSVGRGTQGTSAASAALAEKLDASKPKQGAQDPTGICMWVEHGLSMQCTLCDY